MIYNIQYVPCYNIIYYKRYGNEIGPLLCYLLYEYFCFLYIGTYCNILYIILYGARVYSRILYIFIRVLPPYFVNGVGKMIYQTSAAKTSWRCNRKKKPEGKGDTIGPINNLKEKPCIALLYTLCMVVHGTCSGKRYLYSIYFASRFYAFSDI